MQQKPVLSVLGTEAAHTAPRIAVTDPCKGGQWPEQLLASLRLNLQVQRKLSCKASSNVMLNKSHARQGA